MIYEHFRITGTHVAILDCSVLFSITLHGDDVQGFDTRWNMFYGQYIKYRGRYSGKLV